MNTVEQCGSKVNEGWPAPAKLNLFLHITGQRADGYHLLQTVFQLLDFGDEIFFEKCDSAAIELLNPLPGVNPENDLVVRAARLLQCETGIRSGARIRVKKRIPMGAGLGGGSSDAATTLCALNDLWDTRFTLDDLSELGGRLGADVPAFVYGQTAWAEGVGEVLTPIELADAWYVVITPPISVSTEEIFLAKELTRDCQPITIPDFFSVPVVNVCEPVVRKKYPLVGDVLDWLNAGHRGMFAPGARLTGTGSSIFAAFSDLTAAKRVCSQIPRDWPFFLAKGISQSPLHERLEPN